MTNIELPRLGALPFALGILYANEGLISVEARDHIAKLTIAKHGPRIMEVAKSAPVCAWVAWLTVRHDLSGAAQSLAQGYLDEVEREGVRELAEEGLQWVEALPIHLHSSANASGSDRMQ